MTLNHLTEIPPQVDLPALDFLKWLNQTTIISTGNGTPSIAICCLMHGIEPSGYFAVHKLLQKLRKNNPLTKQVHFIFANVPAALEGEPFSHRHCDNEDDMNRIWDKPGTNKKQNQLINELKTFLTSAQPGLFIDFHNTTGHNPVFAPVPSLDEDTLNKAACLTDFLIYIPWESTSIGWCKRLCTSICVETGKHDEEQSHRKADELLTNALIIGGALPGTLEPATTLRIGHDPEKISVDPNASIAFNEENTGEDLVLRPDIDTLNCKPLPAGTFLGWVNEPGATSHDKLDIKNKKLTTKEDLTFIMLTKQRDVIKKDSWGYIVPIKPMTLH